MNGVIRVQPWRGYHGRLEVARGSGGSGEDGTLRGMLDALKLVCAVQPDRQPAWGHLTMAIFGAADSPVCLDGHSRAASREQAWYPF